MSLNNESVWKFVPVEDYQRPSEPATESVRKGLRGWWDRLRGPSSDSRESEEATRPWRQPPNDLLDMAAPMPNWQRAAGALTNVLKHWLEDEHPDAPAQLLLAAPHSGVSEIAICWAKLNDAKLLSPPSTTDILSGGAQWLSQWDNDDNIAIVIPRLEKCYLRHHDGLALARRLIERVTKSSRRCLLTCDSWAWAFLRRALAADTLLPTVLTLQAFDHSRLERELWSLARDDDGTEFQFLQTTNDRPFRLSAQSQVPQDDSETDKLRQASRAQPIGNNTHLKYIAGYSRGLLKIAWSIWRRSLRLPATESEQESLLLDRGHLLWVEPWSQLDLPRLPPYRTETELLVLHALLLHGGLEADLLPMMLSSNPTDIVQSLHRLHAWQLLSEHGGRWAVSELGYPEVYRALSGEGYLVDDL